MDYETLAIQLEQLARSENPLNEIKDDAARVRLKKAAGAVQSRLEVPFDTYFRLIFNDMALGIAQAGLGLSLWKAIADKAPEGVSAFELAAELGILQPTLERVLRFAAVENMIDEVGEDTYRSNNLTRYFTQPNGDSVIYLALSQACRIGKSMSDFFVANKQIPMQEARPRAWNMATGTDKEMWEWLAEPQHKPESDAFNDFMIAQATDLASFMDRFSLELYIDVADAKPKRFQFIDVGGGTGHISRAVLAKFPGLHGFIAVEDRADQNTVTRGDFAQDGIKRVAHDFFTEQPLVGAKAYYMRNILHDWNDEKSKLILSHLRDALAVDSVILIDDVVLPATGANWYSAASDMMMLTNLGAVERTQKQFEVLFDAVGLKRIDLVRYNPYGPAIQVVTHK